MADSDSSGSPRAVPRLDVLAKRLQSLDHQLIADLAKRMAVARQVELAKRSEEPSIPIVRLAIERSRLRGAASLARSLGLNQHFVRSLAYMVIGEACKVQITQLQQVQPDAVETGEPLERHTFRRNLLALTDAIASERDERYGQTKGATHAYIQFENRVIRQAIGTLPDHSLMLDLGCGTGRVALECAGDFRRVIGVDLSPTMLARATISRDRRGATNVELSCHDMELPLPVEDRSVSLAVMGMGTASEIENIDGVLEGLQRVLIPGGACVLSFYNAGALLYKWGFLPWTSSLAAEIDADRRCLRVTLDDGREFLVYARPYSRDEIEALMPRGLALVSMWTFPTVSAVLPNEGVHAGEVERALAELDELASSTDLGAYALALIRRTED